MRETPWNRYMRRLEEVDELKKKVVAKQKEIDDELDAARKVCQHDGKGGGFLYASCTKCGMVHD
jgi:hypothetical protein